MIDSALTERDLSVLDDCPDDWFKCMEIGGTDASYHSRTLKKLIKHGLLEINQDCEVRGRRYNHHYRLTKKGVAVKAEYRKTMIEAMG